MLSILLSLVNFYFELLKISENFRKMHRKIFQGGSSRKQEPRLAFREPDDELPREAEVRPCEWPSDEFMVQVGIKEEFDAYVRNADLEGFIQDKCPQYRGLIDTFVRRFKFSSSHNSHTVLFDLYDKSYTMDLEDFMMLVSSRSGAVWVILANLNIETSLLVSLWGNLEKSHKLP